MDIFFTVDDKYKDYLYSTLASILTSSSASTELNFHVIDAGLSRKTKQDVEKLQKIKAFSIDYKRMTDEEFRHYPINPMLKSKVYYYRLKIPQLYPMVKRGLFLDTDIIVKSDLSELFCMNMEGKVIGAAVNANLEGELQNERLGLERSHEYFNAGILLLDCEKWRENNILETMKKIVSEKYQCMKWADQDLLNVAFENNYKKINLKWNFWPGMNIPGFEKRIDNYHRFYAHAAMLPHEIENAFASPAIIHFSGGSKPGRSTALPEIDILFNESMSLVTSVGIAVGAKDNGIAFQWNKESIEEYVEATETDEAVMETRRIIDRFNNERGCHPKVLEAGSGNGRVLIYLDRKGYRNIQGIEINEDIVRDLKENYPQINVVAGNILEIPKEFLENDIVLSYGVIEHFVTGLEHPMHQMYNCIKNDGYAVIGVPCLNFFRNILRVFDKETRRFMKKGNYKYHVWLLDGKFYEYHLTRKQFRNECEKAGFNILKHIPLQNELGIMHLINPRNRKGKFIWYDKLNSYQFSFLGKIIYKIATCIPFSMCHSQLCILTKK